VVSEKVPDIRTVRTGNAGNECQAKSKQRHSTRN
jgi:hypothetical protein